MTKYYLIDSKGYVSSIFEILDATQHYVEGNCYSVYAWCGEETLNGIEIHRPFEQHHLAGVYCKWDSCTHWYFSGEDYDPDPDVSSDEDSYYHICGSYCFMQHIREMCFVWKVVADIMVELGAGDYTMKCYYEAPGCKELIETMLKDHKIGKVEE